MQYTLSYLTMGAVIAILVSNRVPQSLVLKHPTSTYVCIMLLWPILTGVFLLVAARMWCSRNFLQNEHHADDHQDK